MIYLRNRYYDPEIGRFISEDPIRDGLNWYVYCSSNPVMFVDPSGLAVTLGVDDADTMLNYLQMLTNDKLKKIEIYENCEFKGYDVDIKERIDGDKVVGTSMIRRLIDDTEHNVTIKKAQGKCLNEPKNLEDASTPGVGSDSTIYFNPLYRGKAYTEYKKRWSGVTGIKKMDIPAEIELGHELIHALRAMGGNRIAYDENTGFGYGTQAYRTGNGIEKVIDNNIPMEKMATTGIRYIRPDGSVANADQWVTTENALRAEHGYGRRIKY